MEEEYSYEYAMGIEKKKGVGYYIGKTLKWLVTALIIFVYGFLMLRIFTSQDPAVIKGFAWSENAYNAYSESPNDFIIFSQKVDEEFTDDGTFRVTEVKFVPSISEIQTTVRYNNSTLKVLAEKYNLAEVPSEGESFIYVLTDANGNEYTDYYFKVYSKNVYNYRQLIFENVDIVNAGTLTLKIYYVNDVSKSGTAFDSLLIFDEDMPTTRYDISEEKPDGATKGFAFRPAYLVN